MMVHLVFLDDTHTNAILEQRKSKNKSRGTCSNLEDVRVVAGGNNRKRLTTRTSELKVEPEVIVDICLKVRVGSGASELKLSDRSSSR